MQNSYLVTPLFLLTLGLSFLTTITNAKPSPLIADTDNNVHISRLRRSSTNGHVLSPVDGSLSGSRDRVSEFTDSVLHGIDRLDSNIMEYVDKAIKVIDELPPWKIPNNPTVVVGIINALLCDCVCKGQCQNVEASMCRLYNCNSPPRNVIQGALPRVGPGNARSRPVQAGPVGGLTIAASRVRRSPLLTNTRASVPLLRLSSELQNQLKQLSQLVPDLPDSTLGQINKEIEKIFPEGNPDFNVGGIINAILCDCVCKKKCDLVKTCNCKNASKNELRELIPSIEYQ